MDKMMKIMIKKKIKKNKAEIIKYKRIMIRLAVLYFCMVLFSIILILNSPELLSISNMILIISTVAIAIPLIYFYSKIEYTKDVINRLKEKEKLNGRINHT